MKLDPRDAVIQAHVPVVMIPNHTALPILERNGHRYLAANDGLWIEVVRPWLRLLWPLLADGEDRLPYGAAQKAIVTRFGQIPATLLHRFADEARAAAPDECAAWIVWDEEDRALEYVTCKAIEASPGRVVLERPKLPDHKHLAIDLHSHGHLPAFFSEQDDEDDAGEVKVAVVFGNVTDQAGPTAAFRLCAHGLFIPLPTPKPYRRAAA